MVVTINVKCNTLWFFQVLLYPPNQARDLCWAFLKIPKETADLVAFAEKMLNGRLHLLCGATAALKKGLIVEDTMELLLNF